MFSKIIATVDAEKFWEWLRSVMHIEIEDPADIEGLYSEYGDFFTLWHQPPVDIGDFSPSTTDILVLRGAVANAVKNLGRELAQRNLIHMTTFHPTKQ